MKRTVLVALAIVIASAVGAQSQWDWSVGPRFYGATAGVRYALTPPVADDVETSIVGILSTAYEGSTYFREADGSYFTVPADGTDDSVVSYFRYDLLWQVGIQQGLYARSDSPDDLAVGYLFYRGQYDLPFSDGTDLFAQSGLPEVEQSLVGSVVGGVAASRVLLNDVTRVRKGFTAELSLEWAPSFLHNTLLGRADFSRITAQARGYVPLYELAPQDGRNQFSAYVAAMATVDWLSGPEIPFGALSSVGGRSPRAATGGLVRGYSSRRFDATFKAAANVDLRMNLPAIVLPQIVPGLVLFTDVGYYTDALERSPVDDENAGLVASSGAGFFLDLFNAVEFVFYTHYLWNEPAVDGSSWVPFGLGFGFHY
jgi:hypothetical protein